MAVLAVLAAHTGSPGVQGGFVGVDVFFVLSGFLITSLLLAERAATGRIALSAFWARRARRLLPPALVMIAAVVLARPLLPPDAVATLRPDALCAALWSSNWRWALQGTDYFAQGGFASPLQHTWSLGVEEQFYVVWPCALLLLWLGLQSAHSQRHRLLGSALVGTAASAVLTIVMSGTAAAGRVYFGTDTRAQELLIGAALAAMLASTWEQRTAVCSTPRTPQRGTRRPIPALLAMSGLCGLAVAVHSADGSPAEFGHGLMLLVATAAAALIAGLVLDARTPAARLLSTRPLVALGRLSYGIYLWHWPIFEVLDGERTSLAPYPLAALRFAVTLAFAAVSLALIELPTRRVAMPSRRVLSVAASSIVALVAFTACAAPATHSAAPTAGAPTSGLDLPPAVDSASESTTPLPSTDSISRPTRQHTPRGSSTSARRRGPLFVDVFGDSIAWTLTHYLPPTTGLRFNDHTVLGCGIAQGGPYRYFGQQYAAKAQCDQWPVRWQNQIRQDRPDEVLLLVGRWETMDRVYQGQWTNIADSAYAAHLTYLLTKAVTILGSTGARVVLATEPYNRRGEQPDGQLYPEDHPDRVTTWNQLIRVAVRARPQTAVLDLNRKLCPNGAFTWTVNGTQVRSDGVHLTPEGVDWLTPWLVDHLRADRP